MMVTQAEGQPFVYTQSAGPVAANAATLRGLAVPNGLPTVGWFEWSTNGGSIQTTLPVGVGDGPSVVAFSSALQNLPAYAVCRCQALASNAAGVARGPTQVFTLGGKVVPWGSTGAGQLEAPTAAEFVAVSAGASNSFALRNNGTVMGWGTNRAGALNIPAGLNNVVEISTREHGTLALTASGGVVAWGTAASPPPDLTNAIAIACGSGHGVALSPDGNLRTWGADSLVTNMPVPLSNVVAISAGAAHSLVLTANGQVAVFGRTPSGLANIPSGLGGVIAVACGSYHNLTLLTNGTVVAWGDNSSGQATVPAGLSNVVAIAGGERHSLAVKADGSVVGWGTNSSKQLAMPVWLSGVATVAAGKYHSLALRAATDDDFRPQVFTQPPWASGADAAILNGAVLPQGLPTTVWFEWGNGSGFGQVTSPTNLAGSAALTRISMLITGLQPHTDYSCRIVASNAAGLTFGMPRRFTTGRKVTAWGTNYTGELFPPAGLTDLVAVAAADIHGMAIRANGTVAVWGKHFPKYDAQPPAGLTGVVAVAGGNDHSLALRADGTVKAWGLDVYSWSSVTNVPASVTNIIAIAARDNYCLALKANGTVLAWGFPSSYNETRVPAGLSNVVEIVAADTHCLALRIDGTVIGWGESWPASVPDALTGVATIGAGWYYSYAGLTNGTVVGWGDGKVPEGLTNVVSVTGGDFDALALLNDGSLVEWYHTLPSFSAYSPRLGLSSVVAISAGNAFYLALGPNVPPYANSFSTNGAANSDCVITLAAGDPNGDLVTSRLVSLPSRGALYQFAGGGRGAPITSPGTPVSDAQLRVIFAPPAGEFGMSYDSFTYLANDGEFDSPPGTATVNLVPRPVLGSLTASTNGSISLAFAGLTNASYRVWASTNLATWTPLGAATQATPGWFQFTNSNAPQTRRFFRVSCP